MKRYAIIFCLVFGSALLFLLTDALAQSRVTPLRGQSVDQQLKDEAACHARAMEQSHYDPAASAQALREPGPAGNGREPSAGAAFGAYGGRGAGAAVGALAGSEAARVRNQQERAAAQRNAAQRQQEAYMKAKAECLQGRGYAVQ